MNLYQNKQYIEDVHYVESLQLPWEKLKGKKVLISGASGLIGSFLIDVIMEKNVNAELNCTIYAIGRNKNKIKERFSKYSDNKKLLITLCDVRFPLVIDNIEKIDYVFHLASNTHPLQYSIDPIGTITTNIIGLQNMLEFAASHKVTRFIFASSNEIYGENRGDVELFDENYCGYINSNTLRAGYPESKRCGEALCQAYKSQKNMDVVIARLTRSYGPTMQMSDTKAHSQFIKKGINGEDIVLKSSGTQYYSYQYVADSVSGLLTVLLCGTNGEAYNIAEENGDILLRDLAKFVADMNDKKVVYENPDSVEAAGYSTATKARLDGSKLSKLGWKPKYDIESGIRRTISILKVLDS